MSKEIRKNADKDIPGVDASGGMEFAFITYLNANLCGGIELVLKKTNIEKHIKDADFVITGEGRLDAQTVMGKAPAGVAAIAKKYNKKVLALSEAVTDEARICNSHGIDAFFPILRNISTLEEAMNSENAYKNMVNTAEQIFLLIKTIQDRNNSVVD